MYLKNKKWAESIYLVYSQYIDECTYKYMNSIPKHITLLQYYKYKYEYKPSMLKLVFILLSVSQGILKYTIVKYISVKFIKSKLQVFFQNISIKEVYLLCTFINCFFVRVSLTFLMHLCVLMLPL